MKLTKSFVKSLQASDKDQFHYDDDPKQFGIKVTPTGAKIYFVRCDIGKDRGRKLTIGDATVLDLDNPDPANLGARQRAKPRYPSRWPSALFPLREYGADHRQQLKAAHQARSIRPPFSMCMNPVQRNDVPPS
jgi:hypothetical protein